MYNMTPEDLKSRIAPGESSFVSDSVVRNKTVALLTGSAVKAAAKADEESEDEAGKKSAKAKAKTAAKKKADKTEDAEASEEA